MLKALVLTQSEIIVISPKITRDSEAISISFCHLRTDREKIKFYVRIWVHLLLSYFGI